MIHCLIQGDHFFRVFEKIHLMKPMHQPGKSDTDQSDPHSSGIDLLEQFKDISEKGMVRRSIGYPALFGLRIEIGISDLHGNG